jgi:hypothetical protein
MSIDGGLLGVIHRLRNQFGRSLYELCPEKVFVIESNELWQRSTGVRLIDCLAWFQSEA